jgi:hypothetical protein
VICITWPSNVIGTVSLASPHTYDSAMYGGGFVVSMIAKLQEMPSDFSQRRNLMSRIEVELGSG